jgi:acyl-CoA thioesterase-2
MSESAVDELLGALRVEPAGDDRFTAVAPDWFGDRVFGGVVLAQGLHAACQTIDPGRVAHSMHAYFLTALRPGAVELSVQRIRDGRTFSTRHVVSAQNGRTALWATVSFHGEETGPDYQRTVPAPPPPDSLEVSEDTPPPIELRAIGPTEPRPGGRYESTRRCWLRTVKPLSDDPLDHLAIAAFLSDLTGTSFRPRNLGEWGTHTDASIDHAVWFHRTFRPDAWLYADFHALINAGARSTVRGDFYDAAGRLCMSMAQELLVRPLAAPPARELR